MEYVVKSVFTVVYIVVMAFMLITLGPIVILWAGWDESIDAWKSARDAISKATNNECTGFLSIIKYIWDA